MRRLLLGLLILSSFNILAQDYNSVEIYQCRQDITDAYSDASDMGSSNPYLLEFTVSKLSNGTAEMKIKFLLLSAWGTGEIEVLTEQVNIRGRKDFIKINSSNKIQISVDKLDELEKSKWLLGLKKSDDDKIYNSKIKVKSIEIPHILDGEEPVVLKLDGSEYAACKLIF